MAEENEINFRKFALDYAKMGFCPIPCIPKGKRPILEDWPNKASDDADVVAEYWDDNPNANIGLVCGPQASNLIVIDVDTPEARERVEELCGCWPVTVEVETRPGRRQLWFRYPDGESFGGAPLMPGLDVRGIGGQMIVPPSIHPHGHRYRFINRPSKTAIADVPPGLLAALRELRSRQTDLRDAPATIPEGSRNIELSRWGGYFRRAGLSASEIADCVEAVNQSRCEVPVESREIRAIAESMAKYPPDQLTEFGLVGLEPLAPDEVERLVEVEAFPEELLEDLPGALGDFFRWNLRATTKPQRQFALSGALALMSTVLANKIATSGGVYPNLYLLNIGPSTCGKEAARRHLQAVLNHPKAKMELSRLLGPMEFASAAAVIAHTISKREMLCLIDEIGQAIQGAAGKGCPAHLRPLIPNLLKLYTASGSLYQTPALVDLKSFQEIERPYLTFMGTSTPDALYDSLNGDLIATGFLGRCEALPRSSFRDRRATSTA